MHASDLTAHFPTATFKRAAESPEGSCNKTLMLQQCRLCHCFPAITLLSGAQGLREASCSANRGEAAAM